MSIPSDKHALQVLVQKLEGHGHLSASDRGAILDLPVRLQVLPPKTDLFADGDRTGNCHVVVSGWLCRYTMLNEGRRQIASFHIAGDVPDLHAVHLDIIDHSLSTITTATVAVIPREVLDDLILRHPGVALVLWRESLIDAAILRTWLIGIGRHLAFARAAHLFCELYLRQAAMSLAEGSRCPLPLTQTELSDALGLTPIHVNRVLKQMRDQGLISYRGRVLLIHDWAQLSTVAEFNPTYLHLRDIERLTSTTPRIRDALVRHETPDQHAS
ncbi:Crp/Fnr family transcriptional regulator [Methylobacterium komagatae]